MNHPTTRVGGTATTRVFGAGRITTTRVSDAGRTDRPCAR